MSPSTSTTTQRRCFNLFILLLAFAFPIYTSNLFSIPPSSQLSPRSPQNQREVQKQNTISSTNKEMRKQPIFILDFDSTVTTSDTISALFSSAVTFHSQRGHKGMDSKLSWILDEYEKDLKALPPSVTGFETEQDFIRYQRSLKGVEERSFARVGQSGILGGIGEVGWRDLGREALEEGNVTLREGWSGFSNEIDGRWGVVSVNFCEGWVRGVLGLNNERDRVEVLANRPNWEGILSSGLEGGEVMVCSEGKRDAMRGLVERLGAGEERTVVYIGDSATDVECLLEDGVVGIVMTKEDGTSGLLDTWREFGDVRSVNEFDDGERKNRAMVYFARDFGEVRGSRLFAGVS